MSAKQPNPEKEIIKAAKSGAVLRVKEILEQDPSLTAQHKKWASLN
ncbi:MAG: hypothetical protein ABI596_14745 [Pyrinomonadaceae bacterium]